MGEGTVEWILIELDFAFDMRVREIGSPFFCSRSARSEDSEGGTLGSGWFA